MWDESIRLIRSRKRGDRIQGWNELHSDYTLLQEVMSPNEREILMGLLMDEDDEGVSRTGVTVMLSLLSMSIEAPSSASQSHANAATFDSSDASTNWLWQPFKKKSAVFGLADANNRRRDELALIQLARHFCLHAYPDTDIHLMRADDTNWDRLLYDKRYQSLCFVGRLGIFGATVADRWGNQDCRFGFLTQQRPAGLPAGTLDDDYHCITERLPDGSVEYHRSVSNDGEQFDYGIVHRYLVRDGARRFVIVSCAGGSALGTLAATTWAVEDLSEPLGPDGDPLPAPPALTVESRVEALVRAKADSSGYFWQPCNIELCKLYAGRHVWSSADGTWHPLTRTHITLITDQHDRVTRVELDGEVVTARGRKSYVLLVKLCEGVLKRGDGVVDETELSRDPDIWPDGPGSEQDVRRSLIMLKHRYLFQCLVIGGTVSLTAEVEKILE